MEKEIKEIKVNSLGDFITKVTPKKPDPKSGRLRASVIFRGLSNADWKLLSSLDRLGCPHTEPHSKAHLEEHLLRNFIRYARPYLELYPENEWEWMVIAQHRGLPTRLLDWTYSPLSAAHFAVLADNSNTDRVVWELNWEIVHKHFNITPIVLNLHDLDKELQKRGFSGLWSLVKYSHTKEEPFICVVEPSALDRRLVAQSAAFILTSSKKYALDDILRKNNLNHAIKKYIIPADKVEYIRDQLDMCSINERRLFPDLEGVASELKRYYAASSKLDNNKNLRR
ncbi:MAG: FRG domain-containing protein [Candidatus Cloacimonetes bacterium]|nr:FRG domain-containing protein [Candidatus Cloacimonadota bacterium]